MLGIKPRKMGHCGGFAGAWSLSQLVPFTPTAEISFFPIRNDQLEHGRKIRPWRAVRDAVI